MESIYIFLIGFLFLLAISDLVVGVSNDAVNFLNSAIGAKAAPFRIIMIVATLGVIVGATFSSGMMEVARKGIFHPGQFYFSEIIIIFLAVMITDVILLDLFNTFGFPTSTTVSIVFELLGAAIGISIIKLASDPESTKVLGDYINSAKALAIISGILLSVVVSFSAGAIVQYISRLLFTFRFEKNIKRYGSIWGGIAITAITYFILIKGAKGSSFMTDDTKDWIKDNSLLIMGASFVIWTFLLQLLSWLVKINILKVIVLVGTFALAMAFAGNDLVNFIGVPLAGYESYKIFIENPGADPNMFMMGALQGKVQTPTLFLLAAGLIMVVTLWLSKKAKSVVKTGINLSRQDEGAERFGSTVISRSVVRSTMNFGKVVDIIFPKSFKESIQNRFKQVPSDKTQKDGPSFDMIRASVNLVVASILISFATSLKLPLSTTYVTFMVAMGTSLADKAWGRESAVYRITGVLYVIGGWFFTAFFAFTVAFLVALLFYWGGFLAMIGMMLVAAFVVYRTHRVHKNREEATKEEDTVIEELTDENVVSTCQNTVIKSIDKFTAIYHDTIEGLQQEDLKKLRKSNKRANELTEKVKYLKDNVNSFLYKLKEDKIETGHYYVQVLDYLRELMHDVSYFNQSAYNHVNNNHRSLIDLQFDELNRIENSISDLMLKIKEIIIGNMYRAESIDLLLKKQTELIDELNSLNKKQIKRIKNQEVGTKNSLLYMGLLNESKNICLHSVNLVKSMRDFIIEGQPK